MSYSRFLDYLDAEAVQKVDLVLEKIFNSALEKIQRMRVQLPGLPKELVRKLEDKNVDFAAHPIEVDRWPLVLDLLSNLAFPLILIGSLLLSSSASNSQLGGTNLPFGLGRSKAKFQMEPNTGVTEPSAQSSDVVLRMLARNSKSEKLAEDIDASVRSVVEKAYEIAKNHIGNNRDAIDKLVEVLLEKETLTGDEFRAILYEFTQTPIEIHKIPIRQMLEA